MSFFEDDPELTRTDRAIIRRFRVLFRTLMTRQERIKFLNEAIRDTEDNDSKKVIRYLLSEVKKDS